MPKTKKNKKRNKKRNKKYNNLRETKRNARGVFDSRLPGLLDDTAKAEYERLLKAAFTLNTEMLARQNAEILELEKQGVDGPARRTRSKFRLPDPDPRVARLANLLKERAYTKYALKWNENGLTKLEKGIGENYRELIRPRATWDMERMAPLPYPWM
jgi:hypothetical protein